jgi:Na+-driven multidrug efflux pump
VVLFVLHDELIAAFTDDKAVIAIGGEWLSIVSYSYFVYGWWMVSVLAFNGVGDTSTPTWINLSRQSRNQTSNTMAGPPTVR